MDPSQLGALNELIELLHGAYVKSHERGVKGRRRRMRGNKNAKK